MHAVACSACALTTPCLLLSAITRLRNLRRPRKALAGLAFTLLALDVVTHAQAQAPDVCTDHGGTATCRGPNLDAFKYRMMPPNFGGAFFSPKFQSPGEAIAQRKADYFQANPTTLCVQNTAFLGWGTDQFNFGPVPKLFMGVEYQNASLVAWTFVPCDPRQLPINFQESVGRLRDPTCGGSFQPNFFTPPFVTYCYLPGDQPDPPKGVGDPPCCGGTEHPINIATGNKFLAEQDYQGVGPFPLSLTRYYNSLPGGSVGIGLVEAGRFGIGSNWRHSYERRVQLAASTVYSTAFVYRPDGRVYFFNLVNGSFVSQDDINDRLQQLLDSSSQPAGWRYIVSPGDEVETYDVNGRLASISTRSGLTQTLTYDNSNDRLLSVADPAGRQLTFAYDSLGRIATITDPAGKIVSYGYASFSDSTNNLVSVTYPDNRTRTYLFNEPGLSQGNVPHALTGIQDENGARYMSYTYDASGRAVDEQNGNGAGHYALSISGITTVLTDPLGTQRTYAFQNKLGVPRNTAITQPCATCSGTSTQSQTLDPNGNVASRTDFNGNRTNYTYDLTRNLETQRVEGLTSSGAATTATRTISTQWHATFRLPIQIAEPKRITTYAYDAQGNVTSKSIQATADTNGSQGFSAAPSGSPRTWTYTNTYSGTIPGLLVQQAVDGPRTDVSDVTTYVWDNAGNLITVTNALNQVTTLGNYDAHGRPQQITDPNGLVTILSYDLRGRLTSRNVGGETTGYTHDGVGQLTQVTLPDNSFLAYTYDAAHRLTQIQDNLGNKISYTLDAMGNRTQERVTDPNSALSQTRSRVYNSLNRLVQHIGANPTTEITNYAYDNQGNLTSIADPLNHNTTQAFDALNRLVRMADPNSGQTQYGYDGLDQLTSVTDPRTLITSYAVDGLGNLNQQASPDTSTSANAFDAAGNWVSSLDASGVQAIYGYDALNRVISASYTAPANSGIANTSILYTYDQATNGIGRLTGVSDATGTTSYSYDQKGRLTQQVRVIGGVSYATSYSYDSAGRLIAMTYPGGRHVSYTLDALGRVNQITTTVNGQLQTVAFGASYRPFGAVQSFGFGSGQLYARSFDLDGRITGYTQGNQSVTLAYDGASRITSLTNSASPSNPSQFGYDNLDRVTGYSQGTTAWSYQYDANGNRINLGIGGNSYPYTISSASNQLASVAGPTQTTYAYDGVGNLKQTNLATYSYDARHRLIGTALGSVGVGYQVNALGQRVQKLPSSGSATVFHYDKDGKLIAESDASGNMKTSYVYLNDLPVGVIAQSSGSAGCNVTTPQVDPGTTFTPFNRLTRLEVRSGRPNNADWQWGLGTNTEREGSFVQAHLKWISGRAYNFTLSYNGQGAGTYTVSYRGTELFSKTWRRDCKWVTPSSSTPRPQRASGRVISSRSM